MIPLSWIDHNSGVAFLKQLWEGLQKESRLHLEIDCATFHNTVLSLQKQLCQAQPKMVIVLVQLTNWRKMDSIYCLPSKSFKAEQKSHDNEMPIGRCSERSQKVSFVYLVQKFCAIFFSWNSRKSQTGNNYQNIIEKLVEVISSSYNVLPFFSAISNFTVFI